jgi:hypothetical protein
MKTVWQNRVTLMNYELRDPRFIGSGYPPSMAVSGGAGRVELVMISVPNADPVEKPGKNPYAPKRQTP